MATMTEAVEMTYQQEHEYSHTLARKIAHALGEGWTYQRPKDEVSWYAVIAGPQDAELFVKASIGKYVRASDRGKVAISGHFPRALYDHKPYNTQFDIAVSVARGADVIAKEIKRRLLPSYLEALAQAHVKAAAATTDKLEKSALLDNLAALGHAKRKENKISWYNAKLSFYGDASLSYNGSVSLKVSNLPMTTAKKLIAILAEIA